MSDKRSGQNSANASLSRVSVIVGIVTIISAFVAIGMYLGRLEGRLDVVAERIDRQDSDVAIMEARVEEIAVLSDRMRQEIQVLRQTAALSQPDEPLRNDTTTGIEAAQELERSVSPLQRDPAIFTDGRLTSGLNMGVDSSERRTDWAGVEGGELCMRYPNGQRWGTVFITVGAPRDPPRPGRDFSEYSQLIIEARGKPDGAQVWVGMKDNMDPDDGSESKIIVEELASDWSRYSFDLARFRTADIASLYVATEFVFDGPSPATVCVNSIEFTN